MDFKYLIINNFRGLIRRLSLELLVAVGIFFRLKALDFAIFGMVSNDAPVLAANIPCFREDMPPGIRLPVIFQKLVVEVLS